MGIVPDGNQDADLVSAYIDQNSGLVFVSFTRPLETVDDVVLDRPWYLQYAYGPFNASSFDQIGHPGPNLWVSTEALQFDCEGKSTPQPCTTVVCVVYHYEK